MAAALPSRRGSRSDPSAWVPGYARAVCRAYQPTAPEEKIEEFVTARMARTQLLDDPTEPLLWAVIDEAALRRVTGGPEVMAEVLRHIADLCRRGRVIVQVLLFSAGAHAAMEGSIKLMDFEDAPPLVYFEGVGTGRLEDDPATVRHQRFTYELLTACALSPQKSLALIEAMAQDYARSFRPQPSSNLKTRDSAEPVATRLWRMIGAPSSPKRPLFGRSPRLR